MSKFHFAFAAIFLMAAGPNMPPGFYKINNGQPGTNNVSIGAAYSANFSGPESLAALPPVLINGIYKERVAAFVISLGPSYHSAGYVKYADGTNNEMHGFDHAVLPDTIFSSTHLAWDPHLKSYGNILVASWQQWENDSNAGGRVIYAMSRDTANPNDTWHNLSGTGSYPTRVTMDPATPEVNTPDVYGFDMELIPGTANPGFAWIFQYLDASGPREVHFAFWANGKMNNLATGSTSKVYALNTDNRFNGVTFAYDPVPKQGQHEPHVWMGSQTNAGALYAVKHLYFAIGVGWTWAVDLPVTCSGAIQADFKSGYMMLAGQSNDVTHGEIVWFAQTTNSVATVQWLDWGNAVSPSIAVTANAKVEIAYFDTNGTYTSEVRIAERKPGGAFTFKRVTNDTYTNERPAVALNSVNRAIVAFTNQVNNTREVRASMDQY